MTLVSLSTITPVHVGSGVKLIRGSDFLTFEKEKIIALLSPEKIFDLLGEGEMSFWLGSIRLGENILPGLLKKRPGLKPEDIAGRLIPTAFISREKTEFYEHLTDAYGNPILPGSALKGAIRTAFVSFLLLNENSRWNKNDWGAYQWDKKRQENVFKFNDRTFVTRLTAKENVKKAQNEDVFRFLQIADASFPKTEANLVRCVSKRGETWDERPNLNQWTECIPQGLETKIRIRFPDEILENACKETVTTSQPVHTLLKNAVGKNLHKLNPTSLFALINKQTERLLDEELNFLEKEEDDVLDDYFSFLNDLYYMVQDCKPNECILRVGKHIGFSFMTGGWQSHSMDPEFYNELKSRIAKTDTKKEIPVPRTRRFLPKGQPIGFVKLSF